jgi:hypothetical protein
MKRSITIWAVCLVVLAWTGLVFAQTAKPAAMKTGKLPSGEEIFDISGEWDAVVENLGAWARFGTYPQLFKITQEGSSFTGIRLKDNPPPSMGKAGSKCMQGEVDKNGIKKLEMIAGGEILPSLTKLSEDGNKIDIDASQLARLSLTRK